MKKVMNKKIIALLLAAMMILATLPLTMFAASADIPAIISDAGLITAEHGFVLAEFDAEGLWLFPVAETGYEFTDLEVTYQKKTYGLDDMIDEDGWYLLEDVTMPHMNGEEPKTQAIVATFEKAPLTLNFAPEMAAELARLDEIFGATEGTAAYALNNWVNNKRYGNFLNYSADLEYRFSDDYITIGNLLDQRNLALAERKLKLEETLKAEEAKTEPDEDTIEEITEELGLLEERQEMLDEQAQIFTDNLAASQIVALLVLETAMNGDDLLVALMTESYLFEDSESSYKFLNGLYEYFVKRYDLKDVSTMQVAYGTEEELLLSADPQTGVATTKYFDMTIAAGDMLMATEQILIEADFAASFILDKIKMTTVSGEANSAAANGSGIMYYLLMSGSANPSGYENLRKQLKEDSAALTAGTYRYLDTAARFEARMNKFLDAVEATGSNWVGKVLGVYDADACRTQVEQAERALQAVINDGAPADVVMSAQSNLSRLRLAYEGYTVDEDVRTALKKSYTAWLEDTNLDTGLVDSYNFVRMNKVMNGGLARTIEQLDKNWETLTDKEKDTALLTLTGEYFFESMAQMSTFLNTVTPNTEGGLKAYMDFFGMGTMTASNNRLSSSSVFGGPMTMIIGVVLARLDLGADVFTEIFDPGYYMQNFVVSGIVDQFYKGMASLVQHYAYMYTTTGRILPPTPAINAAPTETDPARILMEAQAYYTSLREQLYPCVTLKSLTPKDGESMWMTVGGQKFLFKFEQKNGGWLISLDESMIPDLRRAVRLEKEKESLEGYYLSMDTTTKVGQATVVYTTKEDATIWNYSNGSFYQSVTDSTTSGGFWFLFWYIPFGRTTTTTYYLSTMNPDEKLATKYTAAQPYALDPKTSHGKLSDATSLKNGTHKFVCADCGEVIIENCRYDKESGKCVWCGALDPDAEENTLTLTATAGERTVRGWFWISYTTHTVTLTVTEGTAKKIEYSTDNGRTWRTGTTVSSNAKIGEFLVRATDSNGAIHYYTYSNGALIGGSCKLTFSKVDSLTGKTEKIPYVSANYPTGKITRGEDVTIDISLMAAIGEGFAGSIEEALGMVGDVKVNGKALEEGVEYKKKVSLNEDMLSLLALIGSGSGEKMLMFFDFEITIPGEYVTGDVNVCFLGNMFH